MLHNSQAHVDERTPKWDYEDRFFEAAGISKDIFPEIIPSDAIVGNVTAEASKECGLCEGTPVACGAVDNTCMALDARGLEEGVAYTSLGSSSWIAVTSQKPIIDLETRPFVFAHANKGYYTSAVSIFSAGNSFRWIRDRLLMDYPNDTDTYDIMNKMAESTPPGSHDVLFNPSLAGGLWDNYDNIYKIHKLEDYFLPDAETNAYYVKLLEIYSEWTDTLAKLGDKMVQCFLYLYTR